MSDNLLVVIPVYNAGRSLRYLCSELHTFIPADIIFIDDGSSDNSQNILEEFGFHYISHPRNLGKGRALRTGMQYARKKNYDFVLTLDSDLQHPPEYIPKFLRLINKDRIIIGQRSNYSNMPLHRRFSNSATSILISIRCGILVRDSQCGFRLYPIKLCSNHQFKEDGFQFESEILIKGLLMGYQVQHISIPTVYGREKSSMRNIRDTIKFAAMYLRSFFW